MVSSAKNLGSQHQGNIYGLHRVMNPIGSFPQAAKKLRASLPAYDNEIVIAVERLNLDSASFHQLWKESRHFERVMIEKIHKIIQTRGKMHNPVTNSGGTLLGTGQWVGPRSSSKLKVGERIVTLVSLTLTPLKIKKIISIDVKNEQILVEGHAILFESGIAATLPDDFPEALSLAIYDVCGAPALTEQLCKKNQTAAILGAGKAGLLSAAAARKKMGRTGKIFVFERDPSSIRAAKKLPFIDQVIKADLRDPQRTYRQMKNLTQNKMADLVINCVNITGTEMASILMAKKSGSVLFFNMATHFSSAVLGAEGIGHPTRLIMGNGYSPNHAQIALDLVRQNPSLKNWYHKKFNVLE